MWDGHVSQRAKPRGPNRRLLYRVFAANEPALAVLASLWPWLSEPKREQVERVLSELEGRYEKTA